MKTKKLYETDAYIAEFEATVLSCKSAKKGFEIILDKTAFFPEGGGQASDRGFIGEAQVFDVQIAENEICHYTDKPLTDGSCVTAKIDFSRRFAFMQNHTGEHIVSGLAHTLFGVNNVGFHLGEDCVTVDFDRELSREELNKIELEANKRIWKNLPVTAYYPELQELKSLDFRSKKELDGAIRIVNIAQTDVCACCAPHVKSTGEIGVIKLLDTERMRGGIRIYLKCGAFALEDYNVKYENIRDISNRLSAKQEASAEAVALLEEKLNLEKQFTASLKNRFADYVVENTQRSQNCVFLKDCDIKELQLIADRLHKKYGGIKAVFSGDEGNYSFAICGDEQQLDEFFKVFKTALNVRGGGRNGMVQGSVLEPRAKIELHF